MKYDTLLAMLQTILSLDCIDEVTRARARKLNLAIQGKAFGIDLGSVF